MPDLHLYDDEIGQSINYPEECIKILEEVIEEFSVGGYQMAILGGDVQHAKITKTYYISKYQKLLKELGSLAKSRMEQDGLLEMIKVVGCDGQSVNVKDYESLLFSVRGNHDTNMMEGFTFFDLLEENCVLINPRYVRLGDLQVNFLNYSKSVEDLIEKKEDGVRSVISIFHNTIVEGGVLVDAILGKTIVPSKTAIFKDVDVAVVNHIHMPIASYDVVSSGKKTTVLTPGSLGRTAFNKTHDRDFGNLIRFDIEDNYDVRVNFIEVELTPSEQFFDKVKVFKEKRMENAFENFSIEIEDIKISYFDIEEEIKKAVKDEEVRDIALKIVQGE